MGGGAELAKLVALDFARRRLGEVGDEFDPPRMLIFRCSILDEFLQLVGELGRRVVTALEDDKGERLGQALCVLDPGHATLEDSGVLLKDDLHLRWPYRHPAHLDHVVGATRVPEVAVLVQLVLVVRVNPLTAERVFGLFVLVPVTEGDAVTLDEEVSYLARWHVVTGLVDDAGLVAGHDFTGASTPGAAGAVGDEDV